MMKQNNASINCMALKSQKKDLEKDEDEEFAELYNARSDIIKGRTYSEQAVSDFRRKRCVSRLSL